MDGRRIAVAVTPRLLGDVFCRALALDGLLVSTVEGRTEEAYDVAIVSADREQDVVAARVITIDGEPDLATLRALLQREEG